MKKQLYTYTCPRCRKIFRTDDPEQKVCSDCLKYSSPHQNKKKPKKYVPTFAEIAHIAEVYDKIHHKYLHYGEIEKLIYYNKGHCVCCGAAISKNKTLCKKCESVVK